MATLVQTPVNLIGVPVDVSAMPKSKALVYASAPGDALSGFVVQMSTDGTIYDQGFQVGGPMLFPVNQAVKWIKITNAQGVGPVGTGTNIADGGAAWNFVATPTPRITSQLYQPGQAITVPVGTPFTVTDGTVTWAWQELLGAPPNWTDAVQFAGFLIAVPVAADTGEVNYWICTTGGATSATPPAALSEAQTLGQTVTDTVAVWTAVVPWAPSTAYTGSAGNYVFVNGQVYLCTVSGTSGASTTLAPYLGPSAAGVWVTILGGTTASGSASSVGLTGPFPPAGPPNGTTVIDGTVTWQFVPAWTAITSYFTPVSFVYANQNVYLCVTFGTSAYPAGVLFCSGTFEDGVTSVVATGGISIPLANQGPQGTASAFTNSSAPWGTPTALTSTTGLIIQGHGVVFTSTSAEAAANLVTNIATAAAAASRTDIVGVVLGSGGVQIYSNTGTPFTISSTTPSTLTVLGLVAGTYAGAGIADGGVTWDFISSHLAPSPKGPGGGWVPANPTLSQAIITVPRSDGQNNTWVCTTAGTTSSAAGVSSPIPAGLTSLTASTAVTVSDGTVTWTLAGVWLPNASYTTSQYIVANNNVWKPGVSVVAGPFIPPRLLAVSPPATVSEMPIAPATGYWTLVGVGGWKASTLYPPNSSIIVAGNVWVTPGGLTSNAATTDSGSMLGSSMPPVLAAGSASVTVNDGTGQWELATAWQPGVAYASGYYIENEQQGGVIYVYEAVVAGVSAGASGPGASVDTLASGTFPNGWPDNFTAEYANGINSDSVSLQGSPDNVNWVNLIGKDGSTATFSGASQNRIIISAPVRYLRAYSNTPQSRNASFALVATENVINFNNGFQIVQPASATNPTLSAGQGVGATAGTPLFADVPGTATFAFGAAHANQVVQISIKLGKTLPTSTPEAIFSTLLFYSFPATTDASGNLAFNIDALFYVIATVGVGGTTDPIVVTLGEVVAMLPL